MLSTFFFFLFKQLSQHSQTVCSASEIIFPWVTSSKSADALSFTHVLWIRIHWNLHHPDFRRSTVVKRRISLWKLCELLFGLVQHEYCNYDQGKEQDQRSQRVLLEQQPFERAALQAGFFCRTWEWLVQPHKVTHPEFLQADPFYSAWGVKCVK